MAGDLRLRDEPLLAQVFSCIETGYQDGISLRDVASAVGLTPGHLTTVVRRKTGRTVQDWIHERRMAQARRLLVETDQTAAEVARTVGYATPSTSRARSGARTGPRRCSGGGRGGGDRLGCRARLSTRPVPPAPACANRVERERERRGGR